MDTFYSIWRNQFIRRLIRNLVCQDIDVQVTDKHYDDREYKYLAMFSSKDKLEYNVSIRYKGTMANYAQSRYRDVISYLELSLDDDDHFDFDLIDQGVHSLSVSVDTQTRASGQLPDSLKYLYLANYFDYCKGNVVQHVLSNLPRNLKTLKMSRDYKIKSECRIPDTLTAFDYQSSFESLKHLVLSNHDSRVLQKCVLEVYSMEGFSWLQANRWIDSIVIFGKHRNQELVLSPSTVAPHVTSIRMHDNLKFGHETCIYHESVFPPMLQSLTCSYPTPVHKLSNLKILNLQYYPVKLEKNALPPLLEQLSILYDMPLDAGVLPPYLLDLSLKKFNQPLCAGSLPNSLKSLSLGQFNHQLLPSVLPAKLEELTMLSFNQRILCRDVLPGSLKSLMMSSFTGSFETTCQPLDHLTKLNVFSLDPSLSTILVNVKKISIWIYNIDDPANGTCLSNTSIQSLYLHCLRKSDLYANSLPPTAKHLTLSNVNIQSRQAIPNDCVNLTIK
ncbi:hypothetical protein CYY_008359 [Polysphondylium violaceum]|uniref:Uncharacterized protein n=1 Tax=Polysphondylium violaceum TaxID=133409 RepID=A0A8J4V1B5_9MYCE|nr:hypothetical protein CYY_008359 [Polysphondylium violaceum]